MKKEVANCLTLLQFRGALDKTLLLLVIDCRKRDHFFDLLFDLLYLLMFRMTIDNAAQILRKSRLETIAAFYFILVH